jgi:hypothetical protein
MTAHKQAKHKHDPDSTAQQQAAPPLTLQQVARARHHPRKQAHQPGICGRTLRAARNVPFTSVLSCSQPVLSLRTTSDLQVRPV